MTPTVCPDDCTAMSDRGRRQVPFLDQQVDLSGTIMSAAHLSWAQEFLRGLVARYDPTWLKKPKGALRVQWNAEGRGPACFLIELAGLLNTAQRSVTTRSVPRVAGKILDLLRADGRRFEEIIAEFQCLGQLALRASPIAVAPLVSEEQFGTSEEPTSPDFAVRLPDGDAFFEVTVLRFGALDDWDSHAERVSEQLQREILRAGLRRSVRIRFPLSLRHAGMSRADTRDLCDAVLVNETGHWSTPLKLSHVEADWGAIPHVSTIEALSDITFPTAAAFCTIGVPSSPAVGVTRELLQDEDTNELLVKSLRNTLRRKREQFPHNAEYVLVIKTGHPRLTTGGLQRVLQDRIFPNAHYHWLTGVCLFAPQTNFEIGAPGASMLLCLNEKASVSASSSLIDLFEGRRQFHLP
jgi:hypothetical protein